MSTEENKALARRAFEEVLNRGNMALIDEFYDPDYVRHRGEPCRSSRLAG